MTKAKNSESKPSQASAEMFDLVSEIKDLVAIRGALAYGTGTGVRKSAEGTISRAISARVDELAKLIVDAIDA